MLKIIKYAAKYGISAAKKKFGASEVDKAQKLLKDKAVKAKNKKDKGIGKPRSKPKGKPKGTKRDENYNSPGKKIIESMFGRKRKGPTPKRSDSQAYRDGVKEGQKRADEKLDPSLKNKDMVPRSIRERRLDVLRQIREAKESGASSKIIERLESRANNLKGMLFDRPDLTTTRGKFSQGGLTAKHTDYRKSGLFK